jgi:hypothetical protein
VTDTGVDPSEPIGVVEPTPVEPPTAPTPSERSVTRRWVVLGVAALVLLTAGFGWGAARYARVNGQLSDVEAIRRVAGQFGDAALTYDYRDLRPFRAGMNAKATGGFKRQLRDGLGGLEALITELKSTSEATVKEIYVSDVNNRAASAIVVADARVQSGDAAPRTAPGVSIELQLVKVGSHWLIADVSTLDLGRAVSGGDTGASTTTTTQLSK